MATTLRTSGITMGSSTMDVNGSAPGFPARMYCTFINNNPTPNVLHSGNVSSVTRIAAARVRINVATALQTGNYCFVSGVEHSTGNNYNNASVACHDLYRTVNNTTQVPVSYYDTISGQSDGHYMYVAVFAN